MFEVLAFVYQHYDTSGACPEPAHLEHKLSAIGFEPDDIAAALLWLRGLNAAFVPPAVLAPTGGNMRIYAARERKHLGVRGLGFIYFLESNGCLSAAMREVVIERALATPDGPINLNALKLIILMVYWRFDQTPDALVLDELYYDGSGRTAH